MQEIVYCSSFFELTDPAGFYLKIRDLDQNELTAAAATASWYII